MTDLPKQELRALGDLEPDIDLFELGNKKNSTGLYRDWYQERNINYWCTDINGEDGAIPWDIRNNIPEEITSLAPFDIITNFGFTEHVQTDKGQEACWKNIHDLLKVGGRLISTLPQPGFRKDHGKWSGYPGVYYPYPEWFHEFAKLNQYEIEDEWIAEDIHLVCNSLRKLEDGEFTMPTKGMYKNE